MKKNGLFLILLLLILLFAASVLKNIQYPLLWNDEAETAMFAERILKYGYPKVHDGKNIVSTELLSRAVDKSTDAYIWSGWTQFYFAAIGASLAKLTSNFYTKTALLRIPFAVIGIIGILVFALSAVKLFNRQNHKLLFLCFYLIFIILSVSLALHLREVRYYSLLIFLSALIINIYIQKNFINNSTKNYWLTILLLMFLLFNTYYPAYFVFLLTFFIHQCCIIFLNIAKKRRISACHNNLKHLGVCFLSFTSTIPLLIFFGTIESAFWLSQQYNTSFAFYLNQLKIILAYFLGYNFLYLAVVLKLLILFLRQLKRKITLSSKRKLLASDFLTLFFIVYLLVIARNSFIFERYYIVLTPILIIIILLDAFALFEIHLNCLRKRTLILSISAFALVFIYCLTNFYSLIPEHIYELFHQYKGPLDYAIPHIKDNFKNTADLVIATNYEEFSYMYYLNAKTIVGFLLLNLEADLKETPDIIIYRKNWGINAKPFNQFLKKAKYKRIIFPVYDNVVNNVPELNWSARHLFLTRWPIYHLFRTRYAARESECLELLFKFQTINPAVISSTVKLIPAPILKDAGS